MADVIVITPQTRHSPCVGICKLDDTSGYCIGCARTGDEIGRWSGMNETQRDAIWDVLPARHEALSINMRLLPWMANEIAEWAGRTMAEGLGTWVVGAPGALAEFPFRANRTIDVTVGDDAVVAKAQDATLRLEIHDKLRAFAFGTDGPIVLGFPKARGSLPAASTFTALGADVAAVDARHRDDQLFDMGVGRRASRFAIRSGDAGLTKTLAALVGRPWSDVMREAGMAIFSANPHRVVESKLARVEVFTPIPLPGSASPDGAHTHFLPEFLKSGDEAPAGLALPDYAWPVATFYPGGGLA